MSLQNKRLGTLVKCTNSDEYHLFISKIFVFFNKHFAYLAISSAAFIPVGMLIGMLLFGNCPQTHTIGCAIRILFIAFMPFIPLFTCVTILVSWGKGFYIGHRGSYTLGKCCVYNEHLKTLAYIKQSGDQDLLNDAINACSDEKSHHQQGLCRCDLRMKVIEHVLTTGTLPATVKLKQ